MRVRFIGKMPARGYSGGRLLALSMAESLAMMGTEVDFVVDRIPEMYDEFRSFSRINMILADFAKLSRWVDRTIDIVVIVPSQGNVKQHSEWTRHATECHAQIVLLNFESPNWFNSVSPYKRNPKLWDGWSIVSEHASMILSISGEGDKYARAYYKNCPKNCVFAFSYPGINTPLADAAPAVPKRLKQIVLLTRLDPHKGFDSLHPLVHPDLTGYRVVVYVGNGRLAPWKTLKWRRKFDKVGMEFKVSSATKGTEKFAVLKRSALLYFPTRFEGFGLPPLEAAYCLLPCACSDLPVLREFGQRALTYGDPGNTADMHRAVMEALASGHRLAQEHARISAIARMEEWGRRQLELFGELIH